MKLVKSKQRNVQFMFLGSPCTIDKSESWGPGNLQEAPNGAFLKVNSDGITISHLVQPNEEKTAPMGWITGSEEGLFDKKPIWIDDVIHTSGTIPLDTADGHIDYDVTEPCQICYNDIDGKPNLADGWVQKVSDLEKNYNI